VFDLEIVIFVAQLSVSLQMTGDRTDRLA